MGHQMRLAVVVLTLAWTPWAAAQTAERCEPVRDAAGTAAEWLERGRATLGIRPGHVLRYTSTDQTVFNYQSDRSYPPFAFTAAALEGIFDPATGVERSGARATFARQSFLVTPRAAFLVSDTTVRPLPQLFALQEPARALNPWAVLTDWSMSGDVRVLERCLSRDFWRIVLTRPGALADERLYLDPRTAMPVKVTREEAHYLWGTVQAEYLYLTWFDPLLPWSAVRQIDGIPDIERTYSGSGRLVPKDSVPHFTLPEAMPDMRGSQATFLDPAPPDTVRIGPSAFLLKNRGYTELVAMLRDTIYVLDATQSEVRARHDSTWIGRLFPGRHPVVVVVTDLAWPHIGGVRFWVASGATVVSHAISRDFLTRVVERRWTRRPDALERRRARSPFRFVGVSDSLRLAGGDLVVHVMDSGLGTEGALMVYLAGEQFLWAGDYIQNVRGPTLYTTEVHRAVTRAGLRPARTAAQHLDVTEWSVIERLARPAP